MSALLLAGSLFPGALAQEKPCQTIKVSIGSNPKEFSIGATGDFFLIDPGSGKELVAGSKEVKCRVSRDATVIYSVYIDTFYTYDDADGFGMLLCKRFAEDPTRRVTAIEGGLFKLEVGQFKTEDDAKKAIAETLADIPKAEVTSATLAGVRIGETLLLKPPVDKKAWQFLIIKPMESGHPVYNGRRYRGKVSLFMSEGKVYAVNEVGFEDYLRGVVPSEMPANWPLEALKTQAVCARTYAWRYCQRPDHYVYNLGSSDVYQVYLGLDQETEKSNKAVEETAGMLAVSGGEPINAVFHSTSGGMTENSENVWVSPVSYMKAVESPGEEESPHYAWTRFTGFDDAKANLAEYTGDIGDIIDYRTTRKGVSGRVVTCEVIGTKGTKKLAGWEVQVALGLRSTWFDLVFVTGGIVACGRGWGHGVGMSQYGSKAMAGNGKSYVEIVKHYYKGAEVKKWY